MDDLNTRLDTVVLAKNRIEELERELEETQDRANAFATKEYYTEIRAERAEAKLARAIKALEEIARLGRCDFAKVRTTLATLAELKGTQP